MLPIVFAGGHQRPLCPLNFQHGITNENTKHPMLCKKTFLHVHLSTNTKPIHHQQQQQLKKLGFITTSTLINSNISTMPLHEYLEQKRRQNIAQLNATGACHICGSTCRNSQGFNHYFLDGAASSAAAAVGGAGAGAGGMNYNENSMVRPPNLAAMRTCACFGIAPTDPEYCPYSVRTTCVVPPPLLQCSPGRWRPLTSNPSPDLRHSFVETPPHREPPHPPASSVRQVHRGRQGHRPHTQLRHLRHGRVRRELRPGATRVHRLGRVEQRGMRRVPQDGGLLRDGHIQAAVRVRAHSRRPRRRPRGGGRTPHHAGVHQVPRAEHAVGEVRLRVQEVPVRDAADPERRRREEEVLHVREQSAEPPARGRLGRRGRLPVGVGPEAAFPDVFRHVSAGIPGPSHPPPPPLPPFLSVLFCTHS